LPSPWYGGFDSFIHSTNIYGAIYVAGLVPGTEEATIGKTKFLLS
jgi:hypothetical protein